MKYFARIVKESHKMYFVSFPELEGCMTEGATLREALSRASEALNGWLAARCDHNLDIPPPKMRRSKNYYPIDVEIQITLAIMLRSARKSKGLSQRQVAKKIGLSQKAYTQLEAPETNPTLATLKKLSQVLDIQFSFEPAA